MKQIQTTLLSLRALITDALNKDEGSKGDVTTLALIAPGDCARFQCVVKAQTGVISGLLVFKEVFSVSDPTIRVQLKKHDGEIVKKGDVVAVVEGPVRGILKGERVALEFLRHMSGIATKTHEFVESVKATNVTILDTRKTTPGYGDLDKQAVRDGGATNHRRNLSEMGLIKNNHIDLLKGDIAGAVNRFRKAYPHIPLEVEVRNLSELKVALSAHPDRILLDNMTIIQLKRAVAMRNAYTVHKKIPLEASGNMTIKLVYAASKTGIEYISVGALTHTVEPLDISLHVVA